MIPIETKRAPTFRRLIYFSTALLIAASSLVGCRRDKSATHTYTPIPTNTIVPQVPPAICIENGPQNQYVDSNNLRNKLKNEISSNPIITLSQTSGNVQDSETQTGRYKKEITFKLGVKDKDLMERDTGIQLTVTYENSAPGLGMLTYFEGNLGNTSRLSHMEAPAKEEFAAAIQSIKSVLDGTLPLTCSLNENQENYLLTGNLNVSAMFTFTFPAN